MSKVILLFLFGLVAAASSKFFVAQCTPSYNPYMPSIYPWIANLLQYLINLSFSAGRSLLQGYFGSGFDISGGNGADLTIDPWTLGQNFADRTASVGDTITFTWNKGLHGVYLIPSGDCPSSFDESQNGQTEIQAAASGPQTVTYTFDDSGTYWFACPVDGHCDAGMLFKVDVQS
jgi:plastocyanin